MLIYYEQGRRKWFLRPSNDIPTSLWPHEQLDAHSMAASLITNTFANSKTGDVRTDRWFARDSAEKYYIRESCFKTGPDSVLVLLWWQDEQQLIDIAEEEELRANSRSDQRDED